MSNTALEGCLEKMGRAVEHLDLLSAEAERFAKAYPNAFIHEFNDKTKRYTIRVNVPPAPPRIGVLIGDVVHNLRCALDHLVWQLVLVNEQTPKSGIRGNQFPILTWKPKTTTFRQKAMGQELQGVPLLSIKMIEHLQPYRVGARRHKHGLARLQALSNTDKHQLVLATRIWIDSKKPSEISFKPNAAAGPLRKPFFRSGPLADQTEVAGAWLPEAQAGAHLDLEGKFALTVVLDDGTNIVRALKEIAWVIAENLRTFEKVFF